VSRRLRGVVVCQHDSVRVQGAAAARGEGSRLPIARSPQHSHRYAVGDDASFNKPHRSKKDAAIKTSRAALPFVYILYILIAPQSHRRQHIEPLPTGLRSNGSRSVLRHLVTPAHITVFTQRIATDSIASPIDSPEAPCRSTHYRPTGN
jgi:hypothetical protein